MSDNAVADERSLIDGVFPSDVREKFELYSYRGAATILAQNFPEQFAQVVEVLQGFEINTDMIRMPGGSKGLIAKYVDALFANTDWHETRITADLHVKLLPPRGTRHCGNTSARAFSTDTGSIS